MNLLKAVIKPIVLPFWWLDAMVAIPRVVCGYLLTSRFGAEKFGMPWSPVDSNLGLFEVAYWFPNDVANYGGIFALFPVFFAWTAAFSEAVGGLLWLMGLQTRVVSLLIAATMLGAIFLQQYSQGIWNMLPALRFLWVAMYTLALGSGRFGIDYLVTVKYNQ